MPAVGARCAGADVHEADAGGGGHQVIVLHAGARHQLNGDDPGVRSMRGPKPAGYHKRRSKTPKSDVTPAIEPGGCRTDVVCLGCALLLYPPSPGTDGPEASGGGHTSAPRMCSGAIPVVFRMRQNQLDGFEYTWPVALHGRYPHLSRTLR